VLVMFVWLNASILVSMNLVWVIEEYVSMCFMLVWVMVSIELIIIVMMVMF